MDIRELFDENPWWKDKKLIEEDYDLAKWKEKEYRWIPKIVNKIDLKPFSLHILLGPRQCGKTTAIKLLIKRLLEEKDPKSVFYFNCENITDHKELGEILSLYLEFKKNNSISNSIILLDEITLPKEWYRALKYYIDKGKFKNDVIIITGSSSIAVKREVELFPGRRGSGKDFVLYPLSFRCFLEVIAPELANKLHFFNRIEDIEKKALNNLMFHEELDKYLVKYMEYGGFPLSVANININKEEAKKTYASWIKNAILKADRSDIIARQILKALIETQQSDISWEGISKKIEIKSPKTVAAYIDLLKSIFTINVLYNIDVNEKKIRFGKNKKVHFRDPLLIELFEDWCLTRSKNKESAIAEALVIEHLSRKFPEKIFFWRNGYEIDSVILENERLYGFEVKWSEKSETKKPEQIKSLAVITKKEYNKNPLKIPLSVFLSLFDV